MENTGNNVDSSCGDEFQHKVKSKLYNEYVHNELLLMYNKTEDVDLIRTIKERSEYYPFSKHVMLAAKWCLDLEKMSYCKRAQMGTVIMIGDRIFVTGINGTLPKTKNECDEVSLVCNVCNIVVDPELYTEGEKHCKTGIIEKRPKTTPRTVHSETNALFNASRSGISVVDKVMVTSVSPCSNCANNIISSGIDTVIFLRYHDDLTGLHTLLDQGVKVYHLFIPTFAHKVPTKD